MTILLRTAGVTVLGLAVVACGGGGAGDDEDAITDVFRDFYRAFEDENPEALAGLLTEDCEDADGIAERAVQSYLTRGLQGFEHDVTGTIIRDLTPDSAEALPEGLRRRDGNEFPLVEPDDPEYVRVIKVDDAWKLADCNILF